MMARRHFLTSLALLGCSAALFFLAVGPSDTACIIARTETIGGVTQGTGPSTSRRPLAPELANPDRVSPHELSSRSAVEIPGLTGHVIDEESGRGVTGFIIRRMFVRRVIEEATTDESGSFRLSVLMNQSRRLEVVRRPGWKVRNPKARLSEAQLRGEEEIVIHVHRISDGPVLGTARDSITGEPIPHLRLSFWQDGRKEELETDQDGQYRTRRSFAQGAINVYSSDPLGLPGPPRPLGQFLHFDPGSEGGRMDLDARVGATYVLDVDLPAAIGIDDLLAALIEPTASYYLGATSAKGVPVRESDVPWVRMRYAGKTPIGPHSPWVLELASRDGLWRGATKVGAVVGIYPDVLRIELVSSGTFRGRVIDDIGFPLNRVRVSLVPSNGMAAGPFPRAFRTEADGLFSFPWLPPGQYRVSTANDWYDPLYELSDSEVGVSAGEVTVQNLLMKRVESAGSIAGRLTSKTGTQAFISTQVELQSVTDFDRRLVTPVELREEAGQSFAVFEFDEVPLDEYDLKVIGGGMRQWEPPVLRVVPPTDDANFVLLDQAIPHELSFGVIDAETGEAIDMFRLVWHFADGSSKRMKEQQSNRYALRGVAPDQHLSWTIAVPGYIPAFGTEQDFREEVDPPKGYIGKSVLRRAEVRLQRGWGAKLLALRKDSSPVSGARVLVDGEDVGATGKDGSFLISSTSPPNRIWVEYEDWVVAGGDLSSYEGGLAGAWGEIEVRLRPSH